MPDLNTLLAGLLAAGMAAGLVLLTAGIRGTVPDPTRAPSRTTDWWLAVRSSPLLTARLAGGLLLGVLVFAVTRWPVAALGLAALVVCWPALTGGTAVEARQIQRLEALVGWTEALRDTVSAHAGLEQAIPATATTAAPAIRDALLRLTGQLRTRVPLQEALLDLAEQLDHSADMIIAALINNVQRRGDGLVKVLTGLAVAGREELDLRRTITASRAGDRRAMQLMLLIVLAVASFLVLFSSSYTAPYRTVNGQLALTIVLGLFACSFVWIRALAGSRPPARFLPTAGQPVDPVDVRIVAGLTGGDAAPHQTGDSTAAAGEWGWS
jgi:Flp pilus assembly protein TadB